MSPLLIWAVADVAASDPMAAVKAPATSADSMRLDISVPPIAGCCATAGGRRCGEPKSAHQVLGSRQGEQRLRPGRRISATAANPQPAKLELTSGDRAPIHGPIIVEKPHLEILRNRLGP